MTQPVTPLRVGFFDGIPSPRHRKQVERAARACWAKDRWWGPRLPLIEIPPKGEVDAWFTFVGPSKDTPLGLVDTQQDGEVRRLPLLGQIELARDGTWVISVCNDAVDQYAGGLRVLVHEFLHLLGVPHPEHARRWWTEKGMTGRAPKLNGSVMAPLSDLLPTGINRGCRKYALAMRRQGVVGLPTWMTQEGAL